MSMHLFHFIFFIRNGRRRKQNLIGNKITLQLMKFIPTVSISSFPFSLLPFNFSFCFCIKVIQEHILSSQMVINYYHHCPPNCPSNLDYELSCPFNPETRVSSSRYNLWVTSLLLSLPLSGIAVMLGLLVGSSHTLSFFLFLLLFLFLFTFWEIFLNFFFSLAVGFIISPIAF